MSAFSVERFDNLLHTEMLGRGEVRYVPVTDSTNREAKRMALCGAPHGSLSVCDVQTAGRGRLTRAWYAPSEESLLFSLLLTPFGPPDTIPLYTLCAAAAMARALRLLCPDLEIGVKWPNDLLIGGKKLCGILCEAVTDIEGQTRVVIGAGLNVHESRFPPELSARAVSLRMALNGREPNREIVLGEFLLQTERLLVLWKENGFSALRAAYEPLCVTVGRAVRVLAPGETWAGTAVGIDENGRLLVLPEHAEDGVPRSVTCGDVSIRGLFDYI